ncbi:unnamed protein product [Effrenium voratum]|uniref:1,3-beta-glucan synthase n=1 Tax=Effrenium voratum TaxID=2562239 RepID=A0AA36N7M7_9DINO|nr:unnamed protein product [Effrenium voratum]
MRILLVAACAASSTAHRCGEAERTLAGGHSCGGRVDWLVNNKGLTPNEAGIQVATEYAVECWRCGFQTTSCQLPPRYGAKEQERLQMMNCGKVQKASVQFKEILEAKADRWASEEQKQLWQNKSALAEKFCKQSVALLNEEEYESAAVVALYAWSQVIMDGSQCCDLLRPPYCLQSQWSWSTLAVAILIGGTLIALLTSVLASLTARAPARGTKPLPAQSQVPEPGKAATKVEELYQELFKRWMRDHSLRGLYGACHFAETAASQFAALAAVFDFQVDSVRNQFDHLLSLWRSHCAILADLDLDVDEDDDFVEAAVNEQTLLHEALGGLHAELLEGFLRWRQRLSDDLKEPLSSGSLVLGGARWAHLVPGDWLHADSRKLAANLATTHLAEIATYLLVWGEAGNLRFMPEAVYFLTELTLSAEPELYPHHQADGKHSSGLFLSRMVRPMYNLVFDEWYQGLDFKPVSDEDRGKGVMPSHKEKLPTFHGGYEAFLPPDVANYDDWNEFFADPKRLRRGMPRLFDLEHGKRFAVLQEFNLSKMLTSQKMKTHREVHSLWGVFASTHRIWLVHALLFFGAVCVVAGDPFDDDETLGGKGLVRWAALGLLAPFHALLLALARVYTCGAATRASICGIGCFCANFWRSLLWFAPVGTYGALRYANLAWTPEILQYLLIAHLVVSLLALASLLFFPDRGFDAPYKEKPRAPFHLRLVRYFFWLMVLAGKFLVAVVLFRAIFDLILDLQLEPLGRATSEDILIAWYSTIWARDLLIWLWLWFSSLFIFCADTQLWFTVGCTILGVVVALIQRRCRTLHFAFEDALHKLPGRFAEKVLRYSPCSKSAFAKTWNLVIQHMTQEQKINVRDSGELCFDYILSEEPGAPVLFNEENCLERASKHYCGMADTREWPVNKELQWRFLALSRGLGLELPRPYRTPYVPGLTVLIPQFEEPVLLLPEDLYSEAPGEARELGHLIDYLRIKYVDEFQNLAQNWNVPGGVRNWSRYSPEQWKETCVWASMRLQTLWRTVAGMCKYHDALVLHHELQGTNSSGLLWREDDTSEMFQCLVSMQMYAYFTAVQREQVNEMLERFPPNLKIAYIDHSDVGENCERDAVHPRQSRRYYSCLIDRNCQCIQAKNPAAAFRQPAYRVELPGYPILSDGKADNQNHALPFSRGTINQCVDANQGAYFEQMLLLPCALGEFRWNPKQIVGFPEHITSDLGSVGDFAAGSEMAFCTLLQRSYATLGARMHYGHPDLMNKQYMMQQGGVSKGTRTLNLSEDIFAGLDFALRADGREICHREYFHLAKGRDLGFNAVLKFFSKLSSGSGEQLLTRQMCRLGQLMPLPDALTLYYAHAGYYVTQFLLSWVMPTVLYTWALILACDCDLAFEAFEGSCAKRPAQELMGRMLSSIYTIALLLLVLLATALPLFTEEWLERSFKVAVKRLLKQVCTLSFLMFVFQAKIIGYYVINELRYGGAKYISTGRSLPTERRHFIRRKGDEYEGLYLDYAIQAFYDGLTLLIAAAMVTELGGMEADNIYRGRLFALWFCITLTIISWLYAPFVFNPHQFARRHIMEDRRVLCQFFFQNWGSGWIRWYEEFQLKPRVGLSISMLDFNFLVVFLGISVWFAVVNHKVSMMQVIFSTHTWMKEVAALTLLPPIFTSLVMCLLCSSCCALTRCLRRICKKSDPTWELLRKLLPIMTLVVVLLEVLEAAACLEILRTTARWKDYIAGLMLKYLLLEVVIFLAEGLLRSRCARSGACRPDKGLQTLYFWVLSNRMFRDMLTSTVILVPLLLLSFVNSLLRRCCRTFDAHEFLIYRSSGHRARRRSFCGDSDRDSRDSSSSVSESRNTSDTSSTDEEAPMAPRR